MTRPNWLGSFCYIKDIMKLIITSVIDHRVVTKEIEFSLMDENIEVTATPNERIKYVKVELFPDYTKASKNDD